MSRLACLLLLFWLAVMSAPARHAHHHESDDDVALKAGGLQFTIPAAWQPQPPETPARAGQWIVPVSEGQAGDPVQIVVFFFGPGVGGSAQQNIEAWTGTITAPDGSSRTVTPQKRTAAGHAVTEMLLGGTYAEVSPEPARPPVARPYYALWGAVLENGGGNLYWRATGPAAQVTALAPVLDRVLDSARPLPAAAAPPP